MDKKTARNAPRVVFYVQHLLGIGHLVRAFRIAEALADDGWEVDVLAGGLVPHGLTAGRARIVQLPPVKAGQGLSTLVHPDGTPFDVAAQHRRYEMLRAHVADRDPDVLLIEAFPFGRRQMRFELLPLLQHVRLRANPPLIATSVRDILQVNRRPERVAETLDHIDRFFDLVLVHGDPTLVRLDETFPAVLAFATKLAYTGLVAPSLPSVPAETDVFDVIVSVGGGAVGAALLRTSLAARRLTRLASGRWLFLTGPNLAPEMRREVEGKRGDGTVVLPFVPDLAAALRTSAVSVSQAGYNTVADILAADCRAVLVPYAEGGETEQTLRATLLEERGRVVMVDEANLAPDVLAKAIDRALGLPTARVTFDLEGARNTSRLLRRALEESRAGREDVGGSFDMDPARCIMPERTGSAGGS